MWGFFGWACAQLKFWFPIAKEKGQNKHWSSTSSIFPSCLQASIVLENVNECVLRKKFNDQKFEKYC